MPMEEAHTWPLAPEEEPCTLDTTNHTGSMALIWAQDDPAAPRSQRFLRRHRRNTQKEMHLCRRVRRATQDIIHPGPHIYVVVMSIQ